jgi:hypothetical protein
MTKSSGKSKRREQVKRRRERRAPVNVKRHELPELSGARPDVMVNIIADILVLVTFGGIWLGAIETVRRGDGELPDSVRNPTQVIGKLAVMATTTAGNTGGLLGLYDSGAMDRYLGPATRR